jgi:S1-C subfamily serine protease
MRLWGIVVAAAIAAGSGASAQSPSSSPADKPRTVQLTRIVVKLQPGQQWLTLNKGMFCGNPTIQTWSGGQTEFRVATVIDTFREHMTKAGLAPEQEPSLFEPTAASPSEYALAGVITEQNIRVCAPDASVQGMNNLKGDATLTIDWQLYSRVEKQVVANARTSASYSAKDPETGGLTGLMNKVFALNFDQLAANPAIRKALSGRALAENELVKPPKLDPLVLANVRSARTIPPSQAPASVVVIFAGSALGSGFLISRDGYVLTDAHVVGDSQRVRVRWSDGSEGAADVLRISKERDVAILKTDPKGHEPLALREEVPETGSTVFAIGAPEGQRFEGTVTKGVVSGSRIFQGFNYIQSDVTAGHGSSGGPLMDEYGRVIGLTEGGTHNQTSSGIGLFTPIKDAVAFLALDLR